MSETPTNVHGHLDESGWFCVIVDNYHVRNFVAWGAAKWSEELANNGNSTPWPSRLKVRTEFLVLHGPLWATRRCVATTLLRDPHGDEGMQTSALDWSQRGRSCA